ncbi:PRC-barrel domain-containing protein [Pontivivens ytuae]|uniref:PRC-barrel domain protein n=1 Tax=Pontivivens ytuae TaxID=2789856 RepID=A0A7S9QEX8_9RHOB|nr:PRC-barrel domain-containing protein [Pontivivens ytuae]QPH55912.1 hypothetical protein I0K15_09375 [Pontivivens ytuae]
MLQLSGRVWPVQTGSEPPIRALDRRQITCDTFALRELRADLACSFIARKQGRQRDMLVKYRDLKGLTLDGDNAEGKVSDLYLTKDRQVARVAVEFGGLIDRDPRLVPIAALGAPSLDDMSWPAKPDAGSAEPAVEDEPLRRLTGNLPDTHGDLQRAGAFAGISLDMNEGPMGRVLDLVIDTETWAAPFAVVETGSWLPERQVLLPMEKIAEIDWSKRSARVTVTQEEVSKAPDVFKNDQIETRGTGTLLTYYGLSA